MWSIVSNVAGILLFISFALAFLVTKIFYNSSRAVKLLAFTFVLLMFGLNFWLAEYHPVMNIETFQSSKNTGSGAIILFIIGCIICGLLLTLLAPWLHKLDHKINQANQKLSRKHSNH